MSNLIYNSEFIKGALKPEDFPESDLPEIAFVGRSNAGKSTLINRLTNRKKLANTSSKPGRTKEINFFKMSLSSDKDQRKEIMMSDLPGYGYAKMSKSQRSEIQGSMVNYISDRDSLKVVCLLQDSKRLPGEEELLLRDVLSQNNIHLLVIITKIDRLNQKDRNKASLNIASKFGLEKNDIIEAGMKTNTSKLISRILQLL